MNSGQLIESARHIWDGFLAPISLLYRLIRGRRLPWLALILLVSGLMMTVVVNRFESQMGGFFFVIPMSLCAAISLLLERWRLHGIGRRIMENRKKFALRSLGSVPSMFVLLLACGMVAIVVFWLAVIALFIAAFYFVVRLFGGGGGGGPSSWGGGGTVRERLSSVLTGDLIWAEIANNQDGGSKVRPCVVMAESPGSLQVLYCTSQDKRSGDPRYLELPVNLGTGKDNFLNLFNRRTVTQNEFRNRVGTLPPQVFSPV